MCGAIPPLPNMSSWRSASLSTGTLPLLLVVFFLGRTCYLSADSLLNLSDITSKFCTDAMLVTADSCTVIHTQFVGMFTRCGYEVPGMILLHNLKGAMQLITVKLCLCMFHLAPVTISMH
jgi:hypothetical protein